METKGWDSFLEVYQALLEERDLYRDLALLCYAAVQETAANEELELIQKVWRKLDGTSISDSKPRNESFSRQ